MKSIDAFSSDGSESLELNEYAKTNSMIAGLWDRSSKKFKEYLQPELNAFGNWGERNAMVISGFVSPVLKYLDSGLSEDDIMSMSEWEFKNAYNYKNHSLEEFREFCKRNNVEAITDDRVVYIMLSKRCTQQQCYVYMFREMDEFAEYLPEWAVDRDSVYKYLSSLQNTGKQFREYKWYLKALSRCTIEDLEYVNGASNPLLNLAFGKYYDTAVKQVAYECSDAVWVSINTERDNQLYPLYEWERIRKSITGLDVRCMCLGETVLACTRKFKGVIEGMFPLSSVSEDPVLDFVNAFEEQYSINVDKDKLYDGILCAVQLFLMHKVDWLLYIKLYTVFKSVRVLPDKTFMECILTQSGVNFEVDNSLNIAMVRIEEKLESVFLAYMNGDLKAAKNEGVVVYACDPCRQPETFNKLPGLPSVYKWLWEYIRKHKQ